MIKSELIQKINTKKPHLYPHEVELVVNTLLDELTTAISNGGRVELRGFGVFSSKLRLARKARNPKSGAVVMVEEKYVPFFKTGKELRARSNKY